MDRRERLQQAPTTFIWSCRSPPSSSCPWTAKAWNPHTIKQHGPSCKVGWSEAWYTGPTAGTKSPGISVLWHLQFKVGERWGKRGTLTARFTLSLGKRAGICLGCLSCFMQVGLTLSSCCGCFFFPFIFYRWVFPLLTLKINCVERTDIF